MKIKVKKVKNRIKTLRALPYRGSMIYIRHVNQDLFMYDVIFEGQLYSSYIVATMVEGQTRLKRSEVRAALQMILAGAMTTVDMLLEKTAAPPAEQGAARA